MRTIAIFSVLVFSLSACSSSMDLISTDVPPPVASSFQAKYPNATKVEWEAEKEKGHLVFEVEFEFNGNEMEAAFKPDGTLIEEEKD
jgi:hypothetical protein